MRDQHIKIPQARIRHFLFLLFMLVGFSAYQAEAQEIWEIGAYVESKGFVASDPFMDLRYGSGGIIEFSEGVMVFPKGPSPANVMLKSSDLSALPADPGLYGSVQFMQINLVVGSSFSLDYGRLASFPGLRYILVMSPGTLTEGQVSAMFSGFAEAGIVILYQISRPG